jgi:hypothetical protein
VIDQSRFDPVLCRKKQTNKGEEERKEEEKEEIK